MARKGIPNSLALCDRLLAEAGVAVVPGEAFGSNTHFRLSYATSMKELERGLDRIHQFLVA
jgi:aspartate aminotransferase